MKSNCISDMIIANKYEYVNRYRVVLRDTPRTPSKKRYGKEDYHIVENRILFPGDLLLDKNGKLAKRKIIAFKTMEECRNFIEAYRTPIMLGYQQKVCLNRHVPLDYTPSLGGNFKSPWSNERIIRYLGLTQEQADALTWTDATAKACQYVVSGDSDNGLTLNKQAIVALNGKEESTVLEVAPLPKIKKLTPVQYRKKHCSSMEDLLYLQQYMSNVLEGLFECVDSSNPAVANAIDKMLKKNKGNHSKQRSAMQKRMAASDSQSENSTSIKIQDKKVETSPVSVAKCESIKETKRSKQSFLLGLYLLDVIINYASSISPLVQSHCTNHIPLYNKFVAGTATFMVTAGKCLHPGRIEISVSIPRPPPFC